MGVLAVLVVVGVILAGYLLVAQNSGSGVTGKTPTVVGATIKAGIASIDVIDASKDIQGEAG